MEKIFRYITRSYVMIFDLEKEFIEDGQIIICHFSMKNDLYIYKIIIYKIYKIILIIIYI